MDTILKYPPKIEPEIRPILLAGGVVQLEPLNSTHIGELTLAASDPTNWQFLFDSPTYFQFGLPALVNQLLTEQNQGTALPFAVIHRPSKWAIGLTRFLNIQPVHRLLEIATWYSADVHRTGVNTEAKYLLLRHAFDDLNFNRVQFDIDVNNEQSIRAIERIGATHEGDLREHMRLPDGSYRTSALYSITANDWRTRVKTLIEELLEKHARFGKEQQVMTEHIARLEALRKRVEQSEQYLQQRKEKVESTLASLRRENGEQS